MSKTDTDNISENAANNAAVAAKSAADSAITIARVANDVEWMKKSLIGIESKLNEMDKAFVTATQHQEVVGTLKDHEKRIRRLEDSMMKWIGAVAVITFIVTIAISFLVKIIK